MFWRLCSGLSLRWVCQFVVSLERLQGCSWIWNESELDLFAAFLCNALSSSSLFRCFCIGWVVSQCGYHTRAVVTIITMVALIIAEVPLLFVFSRRQTAWQPISTLRWVRNLHPSLPFVCRCYFVPSCWLGRWPVWSHTRSRYDCRFGGRCLDYDSVNVCDLYKRDSKNRRYDDSANVVK